MEVVLAKVNDGMTRVPDGEVVDPTLTPESNLDPTVNDDEDPNKLYRDKFSRIIEKDGLIAAGAFIQKLIRAGLVPEDFDPENKGGSA